MKSSNCFGKIGFLCEHIFWSLIIWLWYKSILFRCLVPFSIMESRLILLVIVIFSCITGIIFEIEENRNDISVLFNIALGYGFYTMLVYYPIRKGLIVSCLLISGVLSLIYAVFILGRKIKNLKHSKVILRRRVIRVVFITRRLLSCGVLLVMMLLVVNLFFRSAIMKADIDRMPQADIEEQSLSNNIETVVLLEEKNWELLTMQERLNVLQTIANIEQRYLGISNELNVGAANLSDGVKGRYLDNTHEIIIDIDSLLSDDSWDVLQTICHEAYHSYQHRMVEVLNEVDERNKKLKMFREIESYACEFDHYIDGEDDFLGYYNQKCESDARSYAKIAVYDYQSKINDYLLEKGE